MRVCWYDAISCFLYQYMAKVRQHIADSTMRAQDHKTKKGSNYRSIFGTV